MRRYKTYQPRSIRRMERKSQKNIFISFIVAVVIIYSLVTWGLPALVGSLSFFNKFKPTTKPNPASETTVIAPPVLNIPFEATNSSSIKISGYSTPKHKVEIYIDDELKNTAEVAEDGSFKTDEILLNFGTNNIYGKSVNEDGVKSLASKTIKLTYSNEKPKLEITEPTDGQQIKGGDKRINVSGKTDPQNILTVNGNTVIVNGDGNFSKTLDINEGDNIISIIATDSVGNSTQIERKVTYSAQ